MNNEKCEAIYEYGLKNKISENTGTIIYADIVKVDNGKVTDIYIAGNVRKDGLPVLRERKAIKELTELDEYKDAIIHFISTNV